MKRPPHLQRGRGKNNMKVNSFFVVQVKQAQTFDLDDQDWLGEVAVVRCENDRLAEIKNLEENLDA